MIIDSIYQDGVEFALTREGHDYYVLVGNRQKIHFTANSEIDAIGKFNSYVRSLL